MLFRLALLVGITALLVVSAAGSSLAQSTPLVDYDLDDDNLIEVRTTAQFLSIHHDLDGDGDATTVNEGGYNTGTTWAAAFPDSMPNAGCPLRDHDDDPDTAEARECIGYELVKDINFSGETFVPIGKNGTWTANNLHATIVGNGFRVMNTYRQGLNMGSGGHYYGVFSVVGWDASIEGLGVVNPRVDAGGGQHGGITGELKGTIVGSYVEGGTVHGGGNTGGMAGSINTAVASPQGYFDNYAGKIMHSYVNGTHVEDATNTGGLIGRWDGDAGTTRDLIGLCLNSYFTGTVSTNHAAFAHGLIAGAKSGGTITNCVADITTDDEPAWTNAPGSANTAYRTTKANMVAATNYDTPATNNPFANWNNYDEDGLEIESGLPKTDFWHFGDSNTFPKLKAFGHDHTFAPTRSTTGADTVNLCLRTLAVANEIIRHLNDSEVMTGVSPTPVPTTLMPCTSASDTRSATLTQLENLVVTSPTNPINLTPGRTFPESERLTQLHADDFAYLTSANHFDLSNNNIESLPPRLFHGVPLRYLDLSHNKLTSLHADLFAGIASSGTFLGSSLLLNDNSLTDTGIPGRVFDPLADRLQGLVLSDNALTRVNTRWFEALGNLGHKPTSNALYTHGLGLHLDGNTITEHYYSTKLFTGVSKDVVSYTDITSPSAKAAGVVLREAIEAAITAAAGGTTPANLALTGTDYWFNSGGSTTGYQASTVTSCVSTQTVGPGRFKYVNDTAPACQIQPHYSPPHKSGDTATTRLSGGNSVTGRTGRVTINGHAPSATFVAHQVRFRPSNGDYWSPWQVVPITDTAGNKSIDLYLEFSGRSYDFQTRQLSTTGPPSVALPHAIASPAANWLTAFTAAAGTGAVGRIALSWTLDSSLVTSGHSVIQFYYRLKPSTDTLYGPWVGIPDGSDSGTDASNETSYVVNGLTPSFSYNVQLAAGIDDNDSGSDINFFTDWRSATATPLTIPANLRATDGSTPGSIILSWNMQSVATTSSTKFQVRRKLRTARWPTTSNGGWVDVPDSTGPGGDSDTDAHNETGYLLSGLTPGAPYDIEVRLHWSDIAGAQIAVPIIATPPQAAAPVSFNATAGTNPGEIDLAWTVQTATSAAAAFYEFRARVTGSSWPELNDGWQRITGSTHSSTSHNFYTQNGSSIDVELRFNWNGPGLASSRTVTTVALSAPAGLNAAAAPGGVVLNWTQQTASTSVEAKYQVRYKLSSGSWPITTTMGWTDVVNSTHETDTAYVSGTPGTSYDVELRFHWSDAVGVGAAASGTATPIAVPAPTGVSAESSQRVSYIDMSWDSLTATASPDARFQTSVRHSQPESAWTSWEDVNDGSDTGSHTYDETTGTIGVLQYYRHHDVRVRLAVGDTYSPAVQVDDIRAGYHPRNLQAAPGDVPGTIELTWDAQTANTESWRRFNSSAAPTGTTSWGAWTNVTGGGSITGDTITGLTKGAAYDVRVMFNLESEHDWPANKSPPWPIPTLTNIQAAIVRPPTNFTATASISSVNAIDLSWDQQTRSTVADSHFEYRVKLTSASSWPTSWENVGDGDDANSHTYDEHGLTITEITSGTALAAGTSYDVQLRFHWNSAHGESTSVSATATSSTIPPPPNFAGQSSAVSNAVDLSWDLVTGATSYQYRYRLTSPPSSTWTNWTPVPEHDNPANGLADEDAETVTGLTGGTGYTFEIRSHTSSSMSTTASTATATSQRLAAPTAFAAAAGTNAGEISLSWTLPTTGNPTGFEYRYKLASAGSYPSSGTATSSSAPWTDVPDSDSDNMRDDETAYTITSLLANMSYEVQIRSEKAGPPADFSLTGASTTATQTAMALAAPASLSGALGSTPGVINLTWTAISTGLPTGDTVVQYQYRHKLSSATSYGSWTNIPAASTTSHTVTGLSAYTSYDFELRAAVDDGDDADTNVADYHSAAASVTAVFSGLARPANLRRNTQVISAPGAVAILWDAQTTFGATFTNAKFQARAKLTTASWGAGGWNDVSGGRTAQGVQFVQRINGRAYDIQVRFYASSSLISAPATIRVTTASVPPPASFSATADFGRVALGWTQQTAETGAQAKYRLRYKKRTDSWPAASPFGWADIPSSTHSTNSHTVTGLDQGELYDFELRFHYSNAVGESVSSTANATTLAIAAPTGLTTGPGSTVGRIDVSWNQQSAATSSDTKFQVRSRAKSPTAAWIAWSDVPDSTGPTGDAGTDTHDETSSNWFTGYTPFRPYDIQVRLVVGTALGPAATATDVRAGYYPGNLAATTASSPGEINVTWDEQTTYTDANSQFRARSKLSSGNTWGSWVAVTDSSDANSHLYDEQGVTLTGLTSGTNYDIQVAFRAGTTWANDAYLPTVSNIRSGIIQTPTGLTAVTSPNAAGAVTLAWTAQTASSLADSKYQYRYRTAPSGTWGTWSDVDDGEDADSNDYNESGVVVLGLTSGTSYNFELRFFWNTTLGNSGSATATATASAIPAPGSFSAASGTAPGSVDLSWNLVRGADDYRYRYRLKTAGSFPSTGAGAWTVVADQDSDGDTNDEDAITLTGLTSGSEYTFELQARVGTTAGPSASDDGTAQTQPPPQNATFSAGTNAGEIDLTWDAPSSGTPTGYRFRYKLSSASSYPTSGSATGSGAPWTDVPDSGTNGRQDESAYTITALWGGVSYDVQIQAEAAVGNSLPGMGTTGTVVATAVAAPTGFSAARGSGPGEIDLSWTALAASTMPSGHSVVQYQFRRKLNSDTWPTSGNLGWTNIPAANTSSYTITGLTAYALYDVQLRAAIDDGDADSIANYHSSGASQGGIRAGLPNPGNVRASGGTTPGSLNLTWTGNSVYTSFISGVFQYRTKLASAAASAFTSWTSVSVIGPSVTSHTITDLMNGQLYDIQLRYQPTSQLFSNGAAIQATPTALAVPTNVRAISAPMNVGAIEVSWNAQSAVTVSTAEFQVRTKLPSSAWTGIVWTAVPDSTASTDPDTDRHDETKHIVTGLSADVRYDVQVRFFMSTAIGGSTPVTVSANASSVPVPTGFDATTGSGAGEIDLTWTAITGATGYDYRYKLASASTYPATGTGSWTDVGNVTTATITNLSGGMFYDVQLRAKVTGIGESAATSAQRAQAQTTPGPATLTFSHGPNPGDIKIDWTRPTPPAPAEHYEYRYKLRTASDSAYSAWEKVPDDDGDGDFSDETTETIAGLQAGVRYHVQFRVYASQAVGYSLPQRGTQASRPVPPPTMFTATGGTNPGEVSLSWMASAGVTILRYEVRHRLDPDGAWSGWANSGTTTTHSFTGLRAGMARTFEVRAVMETVGASDAVSTTGTPTPVPEPATFTAATGTFPGEIDLSWTAVTGATSYEYRYKLENIATWPDDAEWDSVSAALTSTTLTTLDEGSTYDIELRAAITNVGESTAARDDAAARSATFTDEPTTPAINAAYSLSAAEVPGRIAIALPGSGETFIYRHRTANPGEWSRWFKVTPSAGDTQYLIPDLVPGVRYEIQVRAYTGMTTGFSTALAAEAQAAPLEAPEDFEARESSGVILLVWSSPPLYTPDSYEYRTKPTGTTTWSAWVNVEHEGDRGSTQRHYIATLETGISHDFELRMQTQAGPSPIASSAGSARLRIAEVHSIRPVVRSVSVRAGDSIALTVDIYDTQQGLDNSIPTKSGSKLRFRWSEEGASGGTFGTSNNQRRVTYTAPSTPGVYTVQAEAQPDGICTSHHEGAAEISATERAQCRATFTVRVTALPAVTIPRPDPVNPTGTIPTSLTDDEGTSYAVFTPAEGGTFAGDDITINAPAAAVPDRTFIGITATVSEIRPDDPIPGATMAVAGDYYDVRAIAEAGDAPLPSFTLNEPATACLPFPTEFRADLSSVVVVQRKTSGELSLLSTKIRSVNGEITICATLSRLPATIGVAKLGTVPAIPATPEPTGPLPDTGAKSPSLALILLTLILGTLLLTGIRRISRTS